MENYSAYVRHLELLEKEGHIDRESVEEKKIEAQLKDSRSPQSLSRGIASTLSNKKVYKISNDPIEITP